MLAIVVSRADSASVHVGDHLREQADWTAHTDRSRPDGEGGGTVYRTDGAELREFDALHLETEWIADAFGSVEDGPDRVPDLLAFASRHAGETGPLLTAHHTGNFGPAEFGGDDGSLARACPAAHARVVEALAEYAPEGYEVGMECTHHGPSAVGVPSMFVELGSGETQWDDPAGARAVARAILALRGVAPDATAESCPGESTVTGSESTVTGREAHATPGADRRHLVGFGGGHYAPRFERITRETDWAVGHVAADWCLADLGDPAEARDVVRAAFERSRATRAVVDGDHPDLERVVADLGYRVVGETWVRETSGGPDRDPVPLWLADALEDALCPVAEGLRFGHRARGGGADADVDDAGDDPPVDGADDVVVVDLPADLLAEAQGIDDDAARAAVEGATLAFETTDNGSRAADRAAVADPVDRETLVDALAGVLADRYETVERTDGAVVARETAFDPERARTLGVPEGPKFGRLADGDPVEVDGQTVDPEVVHVERERRFEVTRD